MSSKEWGQSWAPRTCLFVAVNLGDVRALIHLAGKVSHATVLTLDWYSGLVELVWLFLQGACHWWPPLDCVAVEEGVPGVAKAILGWLNLHPHCEWVTSSVSANTYDFCWCLSFCWYLTFFVELFFQRDDCSEALCLILKHGLKLKAWALPELFHGGVGVCFFSFQTSLQVSGCLPASLRTGWLPGCSERPSVHSWQHIPVCLGDGEQLLWHLPPWGRGTARPHGSTYKCTLSLPMPPVSHLKKKESKLAQQLWERSWFGELSEH